MLKSLLSILGICPHAHISWPQGKEGAATVTCWDCNRTMPYSWAEMRLGKPLDRGQQSAAAEVVRG